MKKTSVQLLTVLLLAVSLVLTATPSSAQSIFGVPIEADFGGQATAYDSFDDDYAVAAIRQPSPLNPDLVLDLVLGSGGPSRASFSASWLNLKYSDFEVVAVIPDEEGYAIFVNHFGTRTELWTSYVVKISRSFPVVLWSKKLVNPKNPEDGFVRIRQAVYDDGAYAVVGALDDAFFGAETFAGYISASGLLSWSRTYDFGLGETEIDVELLSVIEADGDGFVVGGWITDFASDDLTEIVLTRLDSQGNPVKAVHLRDYWANFTLPLMNAQGVPDTTGGFYAVGLSSAGHIAFLGVDPSLSAFTALSISLGGSYTPIAADFISFGGALAVLREGSGPAEHVLLVNTLQFIYFPPLLHDYGVLSGASNIELKSVEGAPVGALVSGSGDVPGIAGDAALLTWTSGLGEISPCMPAYIKYRIFSQVHSTELDVTSGIPPLATVDEPLYLWSNKKTFEVGVCE